MMQVDWVLGVNNILALAVVMMCWWMAHVSATSRGVYKRLLSLGYGAVGLTTMTIAMFRNFVEDFSWLPILGKISFIALLIFLARDDRQRRARTRQA